MRKLHFLPKGVEHNLPIPAAQKNQKTKADGEKQHQERPSRALMDTHTPSLEVRDACSVHWRPRLGKQKMLPGVEQGQLETQEVSDHKRV